MASASGPFRIRDTFYKKKKKLRVILNFSDNIFEIGYFAGFICTFIPELFILLRPF
jgi:hypothetical protein